MNKNTKIYLDKKTGIYYVRQKEPISEGIYKYLQLFDRFAESIIAHEKAFTECKIIEK